MSKRRRRKSSSSSFSVKKKRSTLRTFIETVMGISIGLLILGGVIWYYFIRTVPEVVSNSQATAGVVKDNVIAQEKSYEIIRDSNDLDDQLQLLAQLNDWRRDAEAPVKLDTLAKRFEIANIILDNPDLKESDRVFAARAALQTTGQLYGICLDEGISTEGKIVDDFRATNGRFINDKDPVVAKEAKLGATKLTVYSNSANENKHDFDATLPQIEKEILELVKNYPNDIVVLNTVRLLADRVKINDVGLGNQLYTKIVNQYESIENIDPEIIARLRGFKDNLTISETDLGLLTKEVAQGEEFEEFFEKLASVIDLPDTGIAFANKVYEVVGFLETIGEHEKALRILDRVKSSLKNRTDPISAVHMARMVKFGTIRNNAVGTKLDFNDTDSTGNPIDVSILKNRACILAYYSPNNALSENLLSDLNATYSQISNTGVKVITIAVEEPTGSRLDMGFHPDWIKIVSIPPKSPKDPGNQISEIFKRFPVSHVPYFAIVDPSGTVRDISVPSNRIQTRVEAVISEYKSSKRQAVNN